MILCRYATGYWFFEIRLNVSSKNKTSYVTHANTHSGGFFRTCLVKESSPSYWPADQSVSAYELVTNYVTRK